MKMKSIAQVLMTLLFGLLILQIIVWNPQDTDRADDVDAVTEDTDRLIEQRIFGLHSVGAKNEKRDWELWADEAVDFKDSDQWSMNVVRATFFTEDGKAINVVGKKGSVDLATKNLKIEGDVVTKSENGHVLKTESIIYDAEQRRLHSEGEVEMQGAAESSGEAIYLKGGVLRGDLEKNQLNLEDSVSGYRTQRGGKKMLIKSDSVELSANNRQAKFLGNVIIDYDTMRLTGPEAKFNYNSQKNKVTTVEMNGGVKMSDVNKWASSKELKVDLQTNRFVFRGSPRVVQDNDELFGEEIILSQGGKNVEVRKVRAKVEKDSLERTN